MYHPIITSSQSGMIERRPKKRMVELRVILKGDGVVYGSTCQEKGYEWSGMVAIAGCIN